MSVERFGNALENKTPRTLLSPSSLLPLEPRSQCQSIGLWSWRWWRLGLRSTAVSAWELRTGTEQLRYKSCASPTHSLVFVGQRFLASSQLREPSASSFGYGLYRSWFPAETSEPLSDNCEGTYILGGDI